MVHAIGLDNFLAVPFHVHTDDESKHCKLQKLSLILTNPLCDFLIFGEIQYGLDIFISKAMHGELVIAFRDMISVDYGSKYWETVRCVQRTIIIIVVYSGQLLKSKRMICFQHNYILVCSYNGNPKCLQR